MTPKIIFTVAQSKLEARMNYLGCSEAEERQKSSYVHTAVSSKSQVTTFAALMLRETLYQRKRIEAQLINHTGHNLGSEVVLSWVRFLGPHRCICCRIYSQITINKICTCYCVKYLRKYMSNNRQTRWGRVMTAYP